MEIVIRIEKEKNKIKICIKRTMKTNKTRWLTDDGWLFSLQWINGRWLNG